MTTPTAFGPLDAARAIDAAQTWDDSLRRRTEGLTWMLWGIVTGAMFLTYPMAGLLHAPGWAYSVLWIPWIVAGNLFAIALWRSARLASPRVAARWSWRSYGLLLGTFVVVFALENLLLRPTSWSTPMLLAGLVWSCMGLLIPGMSSQGKRASAAIGVATALVALGLLALHPPEPMGGILAGALVGLVPFGGGLWQALAG